MAKLKNIYQKQLNKIFKKRVIKLFLSKLSIKICPKFKRVFRLR